MKPKQNGYRYFMKRCTELNFDSDLYDFEHEIGTDLTYPEIITQLEEYFDSIPKCLEGVKAEIDELKAREEQQLRDFQNSRNENGFNILSLFDKPKIIGIVADVNQGKSMLIYHLISELKKKHQFNLYTFGLRKEIGGIEINSVEELEKIKNSIIFVDEYFSLFDLDNRKYKRDIENSLRLVNHKNNILVLCGVGENFKKFISNKLNVLIFKQITIGDLINGSRVKNMITNYKGSESGSTLINLDINEAIVYFGNYRKIKVPYYKKFDSKIDNVSILGSKNVQKKCTKSFNKKLIVEV